MMDLKETDLDELGDVDAPMGSRPWVIAVSRFVRSVFQDASAKVVTVQESLGGLRKHKAWKAVSQPDGTAFGSFEHFCQTPEHEGGLGIDTEWADKILTEDDGSTLVVMLKPSKGGQPGNQNWKGKTEHNVDEGANGTFVSNRGSNSATYLRARIKRDHPDIFSRLEAGDFPSVRQAAIAAGIVKVPPQPTVAKNAVRKLTDNEFKEFLPWFETEKIKRP